MGTRAQNAPAGTRPAAMRAGDAQAAGTQAAGTQAAGDAAAGNTQADGDTAAEVAHEVDRAEAGRRRDEPRVPSGVPPAPRDQPDRIGARLRAGALFRWGFFAGIGVIAAAAAAATVYSVRDLLIRVVVAMFIAISLDPAVRWLTARGMRRGLAVGLIFVVFLAILVAFFMSVIPPATRQIVDLAHNLPGLLGSLQEKSRRFRELNSRYHLSTRLEGLIGQLPARLTNGVLAVTGQILSALLSFLTVMVFTIYFMLDLPRLRRGVVRIFPVDRRERYGAISDIVVNKVGDYMIGRIAIALVGGVAAFIALELLHVPYPLPLAILIGLVDLIPLIGHPIGAAVGVLVALFVRGVGSAVLLGAIFLAYQQLENYVIAPRVLKSAVDLSAAAVLLAALAGAAVLGVVGALIAIPIAAAVKVVLLEQIGRHEAEAAAQQDSHAGRRLRRRIKGG